MYRYIIYIYIYHQHNQYSCTNSEANIFEAMFLKIAAKLRSPFLAL